MGPGALCYVHCELQRLPCEHLAQYHRSCLRSPAHPCHPLRMPVHPCQPLRMPAQASFSINMNYLQPLTDPDGPPTDPLMEPLWTLDGP